MNQGKHGIEILRLIATIIAAVIACFPIALGTIRMTNGTILTLPFVITFFALPCGFLASEFFLLKFINHNVWKIISCASALLVFAWGFGFSFTIIPHERMVSCEGEDAVIEYGLIPSTTTLPSSSELGQYDKIEYIQFEYTQTNSTTNSNYLICHYNAESYQQQTYYLWQCYLLNASADSLAFSLGDYDFQWCFRRLDSYPESDSLHLPLCFPTYLCLISTNDKTHEIVYMYSTKSDYDEPIDFLLNDCGWEHIR